MPWTLQLGSTTQSLADWPARNVRLTRTNLQADVLTFDAPRRRFDDPELCEFGDDCVLTDPDGVVWFRGTRQLVDREASPASESQTYQFVNAWRFLAENVYQQPWNGIFTSHLILNGTIGAIIAALLDRAIAQGADLQYNAADLTALTALPVPNEITGQLMESVILAALQFAPDVQSRFDYSTTPPTLRFQKRSALGAVDVRLADYTDDESMPRVIVQSLRARPDLQVPSVKINYETIGTIDGVQYLIAGVEIAPPGATGTEDGAFTDTVTLQGRSVNNIFGEIECQTIDSDDLEWLKQHIKTLRDPRTQVITSTPIVVERFDEDGAAIPVGDQLPRELIFGSIAAWMRHDNDDPIAYQRETFRVTLSYVTADPSGSLLVPITIDRKDNAQFVFDILTTDAPAGVSRYSAISDIDSGDPTISGLAQFLYDVLSPLQWDGSFVLQEREPTRALDLGKVVNLFGSQDAAHETMRALIQQVTFDIDNGITAASVGPPRHLTLGDLLALFERFRTSRRWTNPEVQDTGEVGGEDSGDLQLGKATPKDNTIPGAGVTNILALKNANDSDAEKYIRLAIEDLEELNGATPVFTKKNVKMRVVTVCVLNANGTTTEMKAGVLMTEPWPIG